MVWFIAITTLLIAIFQDKAWLGALAVIIMWEVFEEWVCINIPGFPFAGKELWINKIVGDTVSDAAGFFIALWAARLIRNNKNER
jgi:hypothetical protein